MVVAAAVASCARVMYCQTFLRMWTRLIMTMTEEEEEEEGRVAIVLTATARTTSD
jgi:hypothetical protein